MNTDITEPYTTYHGDYTQGLVGRRIRTEAGELRIITHAAYDVLLNITDVYTRPATPEEADQ